MIPIEDLRVAGSPRLHVQETSLNIASNLLDDGKCTITTWISIRVTEREDNLIPTRDQIANDKPLTNHIYLFALSDPKGSE